MLKRKVGVAGDQISHNQGLNAVRKPERPSMMHAGDSTSEALIPGGMPGGPFGGPLPQPSKREDNLSAASLQNIGKFHTQHHESN